MRLSGQACPNASQEALGRPFPRRATRIYLHLYQLLRQSFADKRVGRARAWVKWRKIWSDLPPEKVWKWVMGKPGAALRVRDSARLCHRSQRQVTWFTIWSASATLSSGHVELGLGVICAGDSLLFRSDPSLRIGEGSAARRTEVPDAQAGAAGTEV